jgi:tripartite-type tricarboxylate transporter receptor subunit TctC
LLHLAGLPPDAAKPVLFDSGGLAVQAAADGRADLVCGNSLAVLPAIKSGALRGLFDTSPGRLAELPDLPNAREAGVRDMSRIIGWTALVGPPGLPPAVVARWTRFFDEVQWSPEWRATMNRSGALPAVRSPTDAAAFLVDQFEMYRRLAALLHLTREPPPGKAP